MGKNGNGKLFQKLCNANALFIAHPVYYVRPPAGLHLFFERFYPFMWSGKLNGMPFASISQATNNGGIRTAQIDITRWAVTFNLRVIGGLPVHMVSYEEAIVHAEELGKMIAEEALADSRERKRVTPVERYLVSYQGQWSRLESSLMDMTHGTMQYEESLIAYALRHGSMKNEDSVELLHKAGEELKLSLAHYKNDDLTSAAEHMVKMSSFWSPATLREFLPNVL
jgi:multimeric flavodoxin WrbA